MCRVEFIDNFIKSFHNHHSLSEMETTWQIDYQLQKNGQTIKYY